MSPISLIGGSVLLGAVAQISLKHGVHANDVTTGGRGRVSPYVLLWAACFVAATGLWLAALRRADISYAFPLLGAGYVLVTLLAAVFLRERVTGLRWLAILIITAGVILVGVER